MSWRIMMRHKITGKEEVVEFAETATREQAEEVLKGHWRKYVDKHYNAFIELYLEEVHYESENQ